MRGHFSIEWMAQSSQSVGSETPNIAASGPAAWGTHSESLPGFYCRPRTENVPEQHQHQLQNHHQHQLQQQQQQQSHNAQSQNSMQQQTCPSNQAVTEVDFSSGTEEETSGYESEGGQSLSPPSDCPSTSPPSPPVGRRPRTAFTAEQISSLERAFKRNAYLGTQDKAELCKKLNLSDKQIRNWFQNRRMKLKRTVQDALAHACQANVASQFMHYHELQSYRPGPYTRYHPAAGPAGAAEGPTPAASYPHPHSLQYGSALPLDSFYQYNSLPGVMMPSASSQLRGSYTSYPQYY